MYIYFSIWGIFLIFYLFSESHNNNDNSNNNGTLDPVILLKFNLILTLEIQVCNDFSFSSSDLKNIFISKPLTEHFLVITTKKVANPKSTFILFNFGRALFYTTGKLSLSLCFWPNENERWMLLIRAVVVSHHIVTHSSPNEFLLLNWYMINFSVREAVQN